MDKNKSILEKALLQVQHLEEAVKLNSKGILKSTMKEELNSLLNETEEEETVNGLNSDEEIEEQIEDEETDPTTDDTEFGDEENVDDVTSDEETEDEVEDDISNDDFETESEFGDDTEDDEDVLDLTNASDEEVLKIYKSMKPEDGVIVKKDGDDVSLNVNDDEFIIKLNGEEEVTATEPELEDTEIEDEIDTDTEMGGEDFGNEDEESEDEETIYEIELSEEESGDDFIWFGDDNDTDTGNEDTEEVVSDDDTEVEAETNEASRTFANQVRKPSDHGKKFKAGRAELSEALNEIERLKTQNGLYKETIVAIKGKLNEIALFNQKLSNSTRIFTEHSTTKLEKQKILERFENTTTIEESVNLYKTISSELTSRRSTVSENVETMNQIKNNKTNSSSELLSESKAYVNPEFNRIKELMTKINK